MLEYTSINAGIRAPLQWILMNGIIGVQNGHPKYPNLFPKRFSATQPLHLTEAYQPNVICYKMLVK